MNILKGTEAINKCIQVFGLSSGAGLTVSSHDIEYVRSVARDSSTAKRMYDALVTDGRLSLIFLSAGPECVASIYDDERRTAVIRTDLKYRLSEYPGNVLMDLRVLLYHELGHAVQHLDPVNYQALSTASNSKENASPLISTEEYTLRNGTKATRTNKKTWYESYHFDYHLEYNNLRLHEYPVSRELGLPIRSSYTDIAAA